MRRKVVITSALLHNPKVVFFDEPLDGLDANAAVGFKALIQTLAREGKTIVYSSHILDVVERVCQRVIIIDRGQTARRRTARRPGRLAQRRHLGATVHPIDGRQRAGAASRRFRQNFSPMSTRPRFARDRARLDCPRHRRAIAPAGAAPVCFSRCFCADTARGLQRSGAPQSIAGKLALTLGLYALIGMMALAFRQQTVFALSVYLHALTFAFLGMFVASSAGEILFNREEADILLHRPIAPKTLLWAKGRVLVDVSLWLAVAFNLAGFFVGCAGAERQWFFSAGTRPIDRALRRSSARAR